MINLDDNEDDIEVNQSVKIEIEEFKQIGDLSDMLYKKYDISKESKLHFAVQNNSKPSTLNSSVKCSSIYTNYVCVII